MFRTEPKEQIEKKKKYDRLIEDFSTGSMLGHYGMQRRVYVNLFTPAEFNRLKTPESILKLYSDK